MASEPARFPVPAAELPAFHALLRLGREVLERLAEELCKEPPSLDPDTLAESVARRVDADCETVRSAVLLLWRLKMVQRRLDVSGEEFVASLGLGLQELPAKDWTEKDQECWTSVADVVVRSLSSDNAITAGAKAGELLLDQHLVFCSSRVITDMRPVFDDSAQAIMGFLPFHTLVLRCHEGAEGRDLHVAMDLKDVGILREQLERAEQKERLVKARLSQAGFAVINTNAESGS